MRQSFYFERSCPEHRSRAALQPQEPLPRRGPRESWGRGRLVVVVASCKLQELPL
jgi:hypothetical protein